MLPNKNNPMELKLNFIPRGSELVPERADLKGDK